MTSLCPGNTASQPIPGRPQLAIFGGEGLAALFTRMLGAWSVPLAGAIGVIEYDLVNSCATDPPADPGMQPADWVALLTANPAISPGAGQKFQQLVQRLLWFQMCQCVQNPQPTPPAVTTTPPSGYPVLNAPGSYIPRSDQPCWDYAVQTTEIASGGSLQNVCPPGTSLHVISYNLDLPAFNPTAYNLAVTFLAGGDVNTLFAARIQWFDANSVLLRTDQGVLVGPGGTSSLSQTPPTTATKGSFGLISNGVGAGGSCRTEFQMWCASTSPLVPSSPCGPSDPLTQQLLNTILGLVTLIQRQDAPFAYVKGAQHTNLSGTGQIAVSGLLGCIVTPTTVPPNFGSAAGTPTELFNIGWINWGTADGYPQREWIAPNPLVSTPCRAGLYTFIGYTLRPGVVITITEIVREP